MYIGTQPYQGFRARHTYTATAGQTSFSGAGAENVTLTYSDEMYIDVYQNGVKLSPADYTATSGTTVVLATGATVSDIVEVVKYDAFSVADTVSAKDGGGFGGNISTSGNLAVTGTGAITGNTTVGGTLDVTGVATAATFEPDGDTAAGDNAAIGYTAAEGLILTGQGSTADVTIKNDADATVMQILTGTDDVVFTDDIDLNSDGARITFGGSSETIILEHVADTGLNLQGTGTNTNFSLLSFHTSNGTTPDLRIGKSSSNTVGTFAETANGEALGQIRFTGQDSNNATRSGAEIVVQQSANSTGSTVPSFMKFATTGTERMRILGDGDVAINATATAIGGFSAAHLLVDTDASKNSITVGNNRQNGVAYGVHADSDTGIRYAIYILNQSGGEVGKISYTNTAATYATTSDYRVKENVDYDFNAITRLKQLKPCRFNFIADADNTIDGFLAHEVSSIVPEAIVGEKDAMFEEVLYVDGDEIPDGKKVGDVKEAAKIAPQSIDQAKLVPLLVKSLQEAMTRIETLESEVKTLKGE